MSTSTFALPSLSIAAGGYAVVAAKTYPLLTNGPKMVYVANGTKYPSWSSSGFIELVRTSDATTADFVRFGFDTTVPKTTSAWSGASVPSIPTGTTTIGKSIVRLLTSGMTDTNAAGDWSVVNFATPGGPNDVAVGVVDSDNDGIPDSAKVLGGTFAGLDLYAMGARQGGRDIFLEIQAMDMDPAALAVDPGMVPQQVALQKVVDAFAAKNIRLHIDAGSRFSATFNPVLFNLGGGNAAGSIPYAPCTSFPSALPTAATQLTGCSNFYAHKNSNFDVRRRPISHYNLFANSQLTTGLAGSSGYAEIIGNDSMLTMGHWGFSTTTAQNTNILNNMQASTLMHEFGHNLGLQHGGFESTNNYKPNYLSIMNYMYQLAGLPGSVNTVSAADRYKYYVDGLNRTPRNQCLLSNSACGTSFIIDYSDGSSAQLDELALTESSLIGRGALTAADYADWNLTGLLEAIPYPLDLNRDGSFLVLRDYNDWANIVLPFARNFAGANSGASNAPTVSTLKRANPMRDHDKTFEKEEPPSDQLLREIRSGALPGFRR